jgi:hypothetical protein
MHVTVKKMTALFPLELFLKISSYWYRIMFLIVLLSDCAIFLRHAIPLISYLVNKYK